jgi:low temperature requirement protein LtrA
MARRDVVSPEDQRVTFVELFFDLVFVFCVTQIVHLVAPLSPGAVVRAVLVCWLVWWAWTQFTWALNAADTTHHQVQLATLTATAVAFFMAVAIPDAFAGGGLWFAVAYVAVRGLGLHVFGWVAEAASQGQRAAVRTFATVSVTGLVAVLVGGWLGGPARYWLWGAAILLDVIAALIGARSENWNLHPEHFAERHGLIVIIALGESLVVAAGGVSGATSATDVMIVALIGVAFTCALWWTYFGRVKPRLDHAIEIRHGSAQSELARDTFSLMHFPLILGVVFCATALEHGIAHAHDPLDRASRIALGAGMLLFHGSLAAATLRAAAGMLAMRVALAAACAAAVILLPLPPAASFGIMLAGTMVIAIVEHRTLAAVVVHAAPA